PPLYTRAALPDTPAFRSYTWPISSGRPGDDTPDGSYLTIEKANPVEMKGPGYDLWVPWSVRFTFSGAYYHAAYWSVGQQGGDNEIGRAHVGTPVTLDYGM